MLPVLHGPWLAGAGLVLLLIAARRGLRPHAATLRFLGALTLAALALRVAAGLWGPLHVNGQGPLWIRGALEPAALAGYGPGYFELFNWASRLGWTPDDGVFAANAALSALSPALLYAVARLVGVGSGGAAAAALVLAADGVSVRTAASEGYFTALIFLVLAVQAGLALAVRSERRGDGVGVGIAMTAAALLAAAEARVHPAGYLPLALSPLVVFGAAQSDGWVVRLARTCAAGAVVGGAVLLTSAGSVVQASAASEMTRQALANLVEPQGRVMLAVLAGTLVVRLWAVPPWLPLVGAGSLILMLATGGAFQQHPLWALCYRRLFVPGLLLGAAALWPARLQSLPWACAAAAAGTIVLLPPALPYLRVRTTEQLEYAFLKDELRDVSPTCTVAAVSRAGRRMWEIPSYLTGGGAAPASGGLRALEDAGDLALAGGAGECLLYVRGSLCSSAEGRPRCAAVEANVQLERLAGRTFPARPSYVGLPYDRPEVEVTVFRVVTRETHAKAGLAAVSDGAAITPAFARALYERVVPLRAADGCRVMRLDTSRFRMTIGLRTGAGAEQAIELAAAAPSAAGQRNAGVWALAVPVEAERDCGDTLAGIEAVLREIEAPAAVGTIDPGAQQIDPRLMSAAGGVLLMLAVSLRHLAPGGGRGVRCRASRRK